MRHTLTAVAIRKAADGKLFDGGGLSLVKSGDSGKWVYRYSHLGRRREMGLGAWPAVGLADARAQRDRWEGELAAGRDPISVREGEREADRRARDREDPTLAEAADLVLAALAATLRGGGTRGRWLSPLAIHVLPKLGKRRLSTLHQADLRDVLRPIWRTKHPTAEKALQRLGIVLREASLMGYPGDPRIADAARRMLGAHLHVATPTPATPWRQMPALYARLSGGSPAEMCLRWAMLTVVRLDGCRRVRGREIEGDVWTVPADRVKGRAGAVSAFRVPLAPAAVALAAEAGETFGEVLFPGQTGEQPITDRALELLLDRLGEPGRPHGFRAAFRSWVQDTEACSWEVAETALGHKVGSRVERSYARSDLLDLRRPVMAAWAALLTGAAPTPPARPATPT